MNCVVCQSPMQTSKSCSRCKEATGLAHYCSVQCQKAHWKTHKLICIDIATVPVIHVVLEESSGSGATITSNNSMVAAIQTAIDNAPSSGAAIIIPHGNYTSCRGGLGDDDDTIETLVINKSIKLLGNGIDCTALRCNLQILVEDENSTTTASGTTTRTTKMDNNNNKDVVVSRLTLEGTVYIQTDTAYRMVTFLAVRVAPRKHIDDAFVIQTFQGKKFLLLMCDIIGGADGLSILDRTATVEIVQSEISLAKQRGIFANPSFTIIDSSVHGCFGYGIKGRSGWNEQGNNNHIQAGPWSAFGGASSWQ